MSRALTRREKSSQATFQNLDRSCTVIDSVELLGEFLGLTIDSNIKFTNNIDIICNKISRSVDIFYKLKDFISHNILLNLYYSLVYLYLLYGNLIWRGTCAQHLDPLQLLQKKLVRIINDSQ